MRPVCLEIAAAMGLHGLESLLDQRRDTRVNFIGICLCSASPFMSGSFMCGIPVVSNS